MDLSKMDWCMAKVNISGRMDYHIKVHSLIIMSVDPVDWLGKMVVIMLVMLSMGRDKDKESIIVVVIDRIIKVVLKIFRRLEEWAEVR